MKIDGLLKLAGVAYIAGIGWNALTAATMKNIEYKIESARVDLTTAPLGQIRLRIGVTITNNNSINVTLKRVVGAVWYGKIKIANVEIPVGGALDKGQAKTFQLVFDVPAAQVVNDVVQSLQSNGAYSTFINVLRFNGTLYTDIINLNINTNITLA